MHSIARRTDRQNMSRRWVIIALALATGVALELGIHLVTGRREAWDHPLYWTVGLPCAGLAALAIGLMSRQTDWLWAFLIAPGQVMTMMLRSGEIGNLWPLTLVLSSILSAPFVAAAFVGSRLRPSRWKQQ